MLGLLAAAGYISTIPLANWMIEHVGTMCIPNGPCVVPVWFGGIYCPSGSLMIGLALVLRDIVQRAYGAHISILAIGLGTAVAIAVAPAAVVLASATSFLLSELADFAVYTPLYRKRFVLAVALSAVVGLVVDSVLFLTIAFGSLDLLPGIILGKVWMVLVALPFMALVRDYYQRVSPA